jgi:glutathione S-transferase
VIVLHQFARVWDIPNLSPFCSKVETYLRMAGLPYRAVSAVPPRAPRGKLPYITDEGRTLSDSRLIIDHLKEHHRADLDAELSPSQRAESRAFQRMIEEHLHWVMMWSRWIQPHNWAANKAAIFGRFPPVLRDAFAAIARRQIRKEIWGQGLGRHSESEVFALGRQDLIALSDFLAEKPFFLGDRATTLDATAFGLLTNVIWCPVESPLKVDALGHENLVAFCERVCDRYYPEGGDGPARASETDGAVRPRP